MNPSSDRPSTPRRLALVADLSLLGTVGALAYGLRRLVADSLDLRDLPGPGGVKIIAALTEGNLQRDRATELIAAVLPWFSDAEEASRVVCLLSGVLAVLGVTCAARGVAGRTAGLVAGAFAACWSQAVYVSLLIGADSVAMGLAWLGAGVVLLAPALGWFGVLAVPAGVGLALAAIPVKVSAMPAIVAMMAAPLAIRSKRRWVGGAVFVGLLLVGLVSRGLLLPTDVAHVGALPAPTPHFVVSGWQRLLALPAAHPEGAVLIQLAGLSVLGGLIPGRGWLARVVLLCVGLSAIGFSAETVGDKLRPRFLTAAAFPLVVLAGCGVGIAVDWVRRGLERLSPRLHRAGFVLSVASVAAAVPLWQDTLAFHHAWSAYRMTQLGSQPARLPAAPAGWLQHYRKLGGLVFVDTSDQGALDLVRLGRDAPPGGVATVPLRDAREFHMRAGAGLSGRPAVVLETRRCCQPGETQTQCADRVVRALDRAGAALLVPVQVDRTLRVPRPHQSFWRALRSSAEQAGGLETAGRWWVVRTPEGEGGTLPCGGEVRRR